MNIITFDYVLELDLEIVIKVKGNLLIFRLYLSYKFLLFF